MQIKEFQVHVVVFLIHSFKLNTNPIYYMRLFTGCRKPVVKTLFIRPLWKTAVKNQFMFHFVL